MKRYVVLDKKIGETPLQALTAWKALHPRYASVPATYAGRLDPMASGKLLILLGEECKRKERYTGLDKEYEVSVLLDIATDTADTLGLARSQGNHSFPTRAEVAEALQKEIGTRSHAYPLFSAKTVNGIPLFMHALRGTTDSLSVPVHPETIYRIAHISTKRVPKDTLQHYIETALSVVPRDTDPRKEAGKDFRQEEIRAQWERLFANMEAREFTVLTLRVVCGTGAYMRSLAERIGESLGTCALAASIHRTRIGRFSPTFGFWLKQYR